ncbi:ABC transporter permease [Litoribacter populi]|uniref:ABC transporter permease n=1 Tax=Litoribacter populi TaxID=2598460 RepID=UPI00117E06A2|nr:hypothetical protein [Litoribacter populi]
MIVWIVFFIILVFSFFMMRFSSPMDESYLNAPIHIAFLSSIGTLVWLVIASSIAGDAGTRDVQCRMFPMVYTSQSTKLDYFGGKFLAVFVVNSLLLLAIPFGALIAFYIEPHSPELIGPLQLSSYMNAYLLIVLPNLFVASGFQFSISILSKKAITSYFGSAMLLIASIFIPAVFSQFFDLWDLGKIFQPFGFSLISEMDDLWDLNQKNTYQIKFEGLLLWNRLLGLGLAICLLVFAYYRFRFVYPVENTSFWLNKVIKDKYLKSVIFLGKGFDKNDEV